jgi:hypothetical protein
MRSGHAIRVLSVGVAAVLACSSSDRAPGTATAALTGSSGFGELDPELGAPACAGVGPACDSVTLLNGRAGLGPEVNAPNTLQGSCGDGPDGEYGFDESLEWLRISTVDGGDLAVGKRVSVEAAVLASWASGEETPAYQLDAVDLYAALDARDPRWIHVATLVPTGPGYQYLSASYTLADGALQAIRGVFRRGGAASPCPSGTVDEADDLVFAVAGASVPPPPDVEVATYDPALAAPACTGAGPGCTSGELLRPAAGDAREPNAPNTIHASCADVASTGSGGAQVSALTVATEDGSALASGAVVRIAVDATLVRAGDRIDVFHAADADAPTWTRLGGFVSTGLWNEHHELTFTLPIGARQAVRAVVPGAADARPCGGLDHDDLAFAVSTPPGLAGWDAASGVPACTAAGPSCDSGALLSGRGPFGPEPHAPNTLDGCGDAWQEVVPGSSAPSVEALRVRSVDGGELAVMRAARLEATVNVVEGAVVDLFAEGRFLGRIAPEPGLRVVSTTYLPLSPGLESVRAVVTDAWRWTEACGSYDADDLLFTVVDSGVAPDQEPPQVTLLAPAADAAVSSFPVRLAAAASDDVLLQRVEFVVNGERVGTAFEPPFALEWTPPGSPAWGDTFEIAALAFDGAGGLAVSEPVRVTYADLEPPAVSFRLLPGALLAPGPVAVELAVSDPGSGVAFVEVYVDDAFVDAAFEPTWTVTWDASAAAEGPHALFAVAYDGAGNPASAEVIVLVDATPPTATILSPRAGAFLRGVVPVALDAQDPDGEVRGAILVDGAGRGEAWNGTPFLWDTTREVDGAHALQATAVDAAGNEAVTTPFEVVVDNTPPIVALGAPASGAVVDGVVDVAATASDRLGVAALAFTVDGVPLASGASGTVAWDTTRFAEGAHTVTARAVDRAGNEAVTSVSVMVDRSPPAVALTYPRAGDHVRLTVTLVAAASDASGIARVEFWARNADVPGSAFSLVAAASGGAASAAWDTTGVASGRYALQARAVDVTGREASSVVVEPVTVDNTAPAVAVTSPASGAVLSGQVPVTIEVSDGGPPVPSVQYVVDGSGDAPWVAPGAAWAWETAAYADGPHTLEVRAQDAAGNVGVSAAVQVWIVNVGAESAEALRDGGFESGAPGAWIPRTTSVFDPSPLEPAHGGAFMASLCGRGVASSDFVKQTLMVPSGATTLTVRFWLLVRTSEGQGHPSDRLQVRVYDAGGAVHATAATFSSANASKPAWLERTAVVDVSALRGQVVTLAFEGVEDGVNPTTFRVDDVTVGWGM